jgi:hypothetical protein
VKTAQPSVSGCVCDCGISDLPLSDCARMMATAVLHQGIFEDPFSEEWKEAEPESQAVTVVIDHIIRLCDFPADSVTVKYIDQQQWSTLSHVISVGLEEVDEFFTVKDNGITFDSTPMLVHLRRLKAFLAYYKSKTCWGEGPTEDDLMQWTPKYFEPYCCTKACHDDYVMAFAKPSVPFKLLNRARSARSASIKSREKHSMADSATLHDIHQGKKHSETYCQELT